MDNPSIFVLANNIRSLYNVGALFRLCDAVGVERLFLCGMTGAPFETIRYRRQREQIGKTALAGLEAVAWEYHESALVVAQRLKKDGVQLVALEQTPRSIPFDQAAYRHSVCLILGHERDGVDPSLLEVADLTVEIPMFGQGKSLNVISAASVALYGIKLKMNREE